MLVVFTDLDGTLLDETHSWLDAKEAVDALKAKNVPIVISSSKTRSEIEKYNRELAIDHPFVSENGGAIFIPKYYFKFEYKSDHTAHGYNIIELGTSYVTLVKILDKIKEETELDLVGFHDLTDEQIAEESGIVLDQAKMAKDREYDEPFKAYLTKEQEDLLISIIERAGLKHTRGGEYHHITGDNDKGKAVRILTDLYSQKYKDIKTVGIGDSLNDLPLLESVDIPILVQRPNGDYDEGLNIANVIKAEGVGPIGWKQAVLDLLEHIDDEFLV